MGRGGMRGVAARAMALGLLLALVGCDPEAEPDLKPDAEPAPDATPDTAVPPDDAQVPPADGVTEDAGLAPGPDAGPDAALDAGTDAAVGEDAGAHPALDAGTDAAAEDATAPPDADAGAGEDGALEPGPTPACPNDLDCDDGDLCTANWRDPDLGCQSTAVVCDDDNECTANLCDPAMGCDHPPFEDGTLCSTGTCQDGACIDPTGPTAKRVFRLDSLVLADPHIVLDKWISNPIGNCRVCQEATHQDNTHLCTFMFGVFPIDVSSINPHLHERITQDGTGDGYLDLSYLLVTDPHTQQDNHAGRFSSTEGLCAEENELSCEPHPDAPAPPSTAYRSLAYGPCLEPLTDTLGPLAEVPPNEPSGPCFVGGPTTITIPLAQASLELPLEHVRIAGQWEGAPATTITSGLLVGFLPMRQADQQQDTVSLSDDFFDVNLNLGRDLLPDNGNAHGCGCVPRTFPDEDTRGSNDHALGNHDQAGCPDDPGDSRDLFNPDAEASYDNCGWWFHLNFTGVFVEDATGF
jgi:hypothetical protein